MISKQKPSSEYGSYFKQMQCCIDPVRIGFLRFLLEGYDEMAIVSTINSREGTILLRYAGCFEPQLLAILKSLDAYTKQCKSI